MEDTTIPDLQLQDGRPDSAFGEVVGSSRTSSQIRPSLPLLDQLIVLFASMQSANRLLQTLRAGQPALGVWQMLPGANLTRTLARSSPHLSWLVVDQEHGNLSDDSMHDAVAAAAACGVSPIVRVPDAQHWMLKRALDAGAHGVVVPLLRDASQAREVVKWAKFPPRGTRGFGSPLPMEKFEQVGAVEYLQQANDATLVIVQIETDTALKNVKEIAAVDGIDVLFIGPFDLGNNIGHPIVSARRDKELEDAIETIHQAAREAGKTTGIYATSGEEAKGFVQRGFGMVSCVTDIPALAQGVKSALDTAMSGA